MVVTLVMAPKSVTFRRHDHLVSVLFGDLLSHSYNITFSMFLDLVYIGIDEIQCIEWTMINPALEEASQNYPNELMSI